MKSKRARWFIGGFVALCGLVFFVFISLREHPDYRRGAEALPEARRRAEELMGALTWAEHREQRGVEAADDEDRWVALENSIPEMFEQYDESYFGGTVLWPVAELYTENRDWLFSLAPQIEPLRLTRPTTEEELDTPFGDDILASRMLLKKLRYLLLGAADAGDVDGVREAGRVGWMIIERQIEEYNIGTYMISSSGFHQMERYIVMGAVRNRDNKEIVQVLREVMASMPVRPPYYEAVIGVARTYGVLFQTLKDKRPGEVEAWIDHWWGAESQYQDGGAVGAWIRTSLQKLSGKDEPVSNRIVGKHTAAALEARFYEAMADCAEVARELSYSKGDAHIRMQELDDFLQAYKDRSYEFAAITVPAGSADFGENLYLTMYEASKIALELIARYSELVGLPETVPPDLVSPDPFGGEPLLYMKTPHGFIVYSRGENRVDDGFPLLGPEYLESQTTFTKSRDNLDWGLMIAYDAPDPLP